MWPPITHEALVFAVMAAGGAALGILFDIERALRSGFKTGRVIMHITDLLFWAAAGAVSVYLLIRFNDGALRFYEFAGMILGAVLYFCTLSMFIRKIFTAVFEILHKFIILILKIVLTPLAFLYKILIGLFNALRRLFTDKRIQKNGKKKKKEENKTGEGFSA